VRRGDESDEPPSSLATNPLTLDTPAGRPDRPTANLPVAHLGE